MVKAGVLIFVVTLLQVGFSRVLYSQEPKVVGSRPSIPKDQIPKDIPEDTRQLIEELYSWFPGDRADAAWNLGFHPEKAVPEIPFLVAMLHDDVRMKDAITGAGSSPAKQAAKTLVKIGRPSIEPLIKALRSKDDRVLDNGSWALKEITGEDFGRDFSKWQDWWVKQKKNPK